MVDRLCAMSDLKLRVAIIPTDAQRFATGGAEALRPSRYRTGSSP
jgi:hypothetical protein